MGTWAALLLAFALVSGARADTVESYNLTLTDQSPVISYSPSRSGSSASTWNVSYTGSPWSSYAQETIGNGTSSHYTTFVGASASVSWTGTAIYVYGSASASDYVVAVDGANQTSTPGGGLLAAISGLKYGNHSLSLLVTGNGGVSLTRIKLGLNMGSSGNNTQAALWGSGSNFNPSFDTSVGQWEAATQLGGGAATPAGPAAPAASASGAINYPRIDTHTPNSILSLQPPYGTSLVILYGSVNFDHGPYTVTLSSPSANITRNYTAISPWASINQVTFFGVLRQDQQYLLQVEFEGKASQYWDIAAATFISASGGTSTNSNRSSTNIGAIVGGVLGGVAALGIALALAFYVARRKSAPAVVPPARPANDRGPFEIDEPYKEEPLPEDQAGYYDDPQMAYANAAAGMPSSFHDPAAVRVTPLVIPAYLDATARPSEPSEYLAGSPSRLSFVSASAATTPFAEAALSRRDSYPAATSPRPDGGGGNTKRWSTGSSIREERERGVGSGVQREDTMRAAERKARMYEEDRRRSMRLEPEDLLDDTYRSEHGEELEEGPGQEVEVVQERDAGRVMVPPTYDPAWAQGHHRTHHGQFGAGGGSASPGTQGTFGGH